MQYLDITDKAYRRLHKFADYNALTVSEAIEILLDDEEVFQRDGRSE